MTQSTTKRCAARPICRPFGCSGDENRLCVLTNRSSLGVFFFFFKRRMIQLFGLVGLLVGSVNELLWLLIRGVVRVVEGIVVVCLLFVVLLVEDSNRGGRISVSLLSCSIVVGYLL